MVWSGKDEEGSDKRIGKKRESKNSHEYTIEQSFHTIEIFLEFFFSTLSSSW